MYSRQTRTLPRGSSRRPRTSPRRIVEDKFIKPFIPYRIELVNGVRLLQHLVELAKSGTS